MRLNSTVASLAIGFLFGIWLGIGVPAALLVWIRRPQVALLRKLAVSAWVVLQGPIGFATLDDYLSATRGASE